MEVQAAGRRRERVAGDSDEVHRAAETLKCPARRAASGRFGRFCKGPCRVGERGFSDASITAITSAPTSHWDLSTLTSQQGGVFKALVGEMSAQVATGRAGADGSVRRHRAERAHWPLPALRKQHKEVYDHRQAEFVVLRASGHYETTAARIAARLSSGAEKGEFRNDESDFQ